MAHNDFIFGGYKQISDDSERTSKYVDDSPKKAQYVPKKNILCKY